MKLSLKRNKRPKVVSPDDRMTLTEHLAELRTRIIRALLAVVIGVIVLLALYDQVLDFLRRPYENLCDRKPNLTCDLQFIGPLEGFTTRLSICTYGGIIIALPVIMWQVWRFVVPALHAKEKKYAIPFVLSSVLLFLLGAAVAYWTLTPALDFLISWSGSDVKANFQVSKYVNLVGLMVAAFGIAFEFPVLLVFLQLVGVLTPQTLLKGWRYAIMAIFVIAAVITPSGDPYSMLALALPMTLFYLISIVIGLLFQKRKRAADAAAN
ncbi:MAG: sec-independent protein translocase protein TatC [Ilumatobacteraceae bacterium]